MSAENTLDGTILGELRVSRFLLESLLPEQHIDSFRPGHLQNPYALPQSLKATDYRYSSSVSANDSLTHLPFRLTYNRGWTTQTDIFEFPVTIEDEADPGLMSRIDQSLELCNNISRYGGVVVVLIHPDVLGEKIEFEERLIKAYKDQAYMASIRSFGAFWAGRADTQVDVMPLKDKGFQLSVTMPRPIDGLALTIPGGFKAVKAITPGVDIELKGPFLVIRKPVKGTMTFNVTTPPKRALKGKSQQRIKPIPAPSVERLPAGADA
jgi:hypothetical protein